MKHCGFALGSGPAATVEPDSANGRNSGESAHCGLDYVKTINTTSERVSDHLTEDTFGSQSDYKVQWFKGKTNITEDVQALGYAFGLRAGHARIFRVRVKPLVNDPEWLCLYANTVGSKVAGDETPHGVCCQRPQQRRHLLNEGRLRAASAW